MQGFTGVTAEKSYKSAKMVLPDMLFMAALAHRMERGLRLHEQANQ